jgi:hypothetical protein
MDADTIEPIEPEAERRHSERQKLTAWIEWQVGGSVLSIERLSRWRLMWRVELQGSGGMKTLLVKGERTWNILPYSLACHLFAGPAAAKDHLMFARMEPIVNP